MSLKKPASLAITAGLALAILPVTTQLALAADPPSATVSVDRTSVGVGQTLNVSWQVTGGTAPAVTGGEICADIPLPNPFEGSAEQCTPVSLGSSPALKGSAAVTVPDFAANAYLNLVVSDQGTQSTFPSKRFDVTGYTGWAVVSDSSAQRLSYYANGVAKTGWFEAPNANAGGNLTYYADDQGMVQHQKWVNSNGKWYYLGANGAMEVNQWADIDGSRYFLGLDGSVVTGWGTISGNEYYFDSTGKQQTGWQKIDGDWYYLDPSQGGEAVTGSNYIDGKWYFMDQDGKTDLGWFQVGDKWYYADDSGAVMNGWQQIKGKWYYLDPNDHAALVTGWQKIDNVWYFMDSNGVMQTGWVKNGGKSYYMDKNGQMKTGWQQIDGAWYYLNSDGSMQTGWLQLNGSSFYLDPKTGVMATGFATIDGKTQQFDNSGKLLGDGPPSEFTLKDLQYHGILWWNDEKYSYASQSVMPGDGLDIPGRHINEGGFVADKDGYIVLGAEDGIAKGTVYETPFGSPGKVYDSCSTCTAQPLWFNVYTN